ncbi:hypothetical protein RJ639_013912 [Escallonia herrerae]|uniref:Cytochrome P450 n=1 Tax=Escallonia herrerae TaxID=1293975 RepID=A0AA89ANK6_9ASTE|nr:hypothetical protein RJ639_013912 [Escallonia herrerae]
MEAELLFAVKILLSLVLSGFVGLVVSLFDALFLKPKRLRSKLQSQGISGPSPCFYFGNIPEMKNIKQQIRSKATTAAKDHDHCHHLGQGGTLFHDWFTTVFPHIEQWQKEYGTIFTYSMGNIQILCVSDPEMVKEVTLHTSLSLGKPSYLSKDRGPLLGNGIVSSSGPYWAHQRKIIAPEFYLDKVKDMVSLMAGSTARMLESWERKVGNKGGCVEIRVDRDLRSLSADIIARACFGSNYLQAEKAFLKLEDLQNILSNGKIGVPGLRYMPTKPNREAWQLDKQINSVILSMVRARNQATSEKDLLKSLQEAAKRYEDNGDLPSDISCDKFIVDNCKNIYLAGYDTTATAISWCLVLLAAHPDWQARTRMEVHDICGDNLPDADKLRSMKVLTMVIQETLRLYPPVADMVRETMQDVSLNGIHIPKGINLQITRPTLHQDPNLWGPDAHQFNPERFSEGLKGACTSPHVYMPFGAGTRICAGQHFAMAELKVILSQILSRFSFTLSPSYRHSPVFRLVIKPEHGVHLHIWKV